MFEVLVPLILPPLKEHIRLGYAGIVNHSVSSINTRLKKKYLKKEGTTINNNNNKQQQQQ